jgi:hypothetical protein
MDFSSKLRLILGLIFFLYNCESVTVKLDIDNIDVCCLVRTFIGHESQLIVLLASLTDAALHAKNIRIKFFIIDTDPVQSVGNFYVERTILHLRQQYLNDIYHHVIFKNHSYQPRLTYGYDATDQLLTAILDSSIPSATNENCAYFLVTNGDNYYSHYLFKEIEDGLKSHIDLIAFNYIHRWNAYGVQLQHSAIDLGAAVVSGRAILNARAMFLPKGLDTEDMVARDWYFFQFILKAINSTNSIVRKTLFVHI